MTECDISGCRLLQTTCVTCGRVVCSKTFPEVREWISIESQLPKEGEYVLLGGTKRVETGFWDGKVFFCPEPEYFELDWVTHWMELPEPPKEKE